MLIPTTGSLEPWLGGHRSNGKQTRKTAIREPPVSVSAPDICPSPAKKELDFRSEWSVTVERTRGPTGQFWILPCCGHAATAGL